MTNGITVEQAANHDAVEAHVKSGDMEYLRVRPYGNCVLFANLVRSSKVRMGNVAIERGERKGDESLRVHVTPIGQQ